MRTSIFAALVSLALVGCDPGGTAGAEWVVGTWNATAVYRYDPHPPGPLALAQEMRLDETSRQDLARARKARSVRVSVALARVFEPDGRVEERVVRRLRTTSDGEAVEDMPAVQSAAGTWRMDGEVIEVTWNRIPAWIEDRHAELGPLLDVMPTLDVLPTVPYTERLTRRSPLELRIDPEDESAPDAVLRLRWKHQAE